MFCIVYALSFPILTSVEASWGAPPWALPFSVHTSASLDVGSRKKKKKNIYLEAYALPPTLNRGSVSTVSRLKAA